MTFGVFRWIDYLCTHGNSNTSGYHDYHRSVPKQLDATSRAITTQLARARFARPRPETPVSFCATHLTKTNHNTITGLTNPTRNAVGVGLGLVGTLGNPPAPARPRPLFPCA